MDSKKKKVFITGCGGMLGEAFYAFFKNKFIVKASDIDVNEEWLSYLDVRDYSEYRKQALEFKPDICIHLAALTDLEYCELHPDEAYATNTTAVENSVLIARELGAKLVYISTAGIFNGKQEYYDDWSSPDPINVYGRAKHMGEVYVEKNYDKYFVCRAGWMMGGGPTKDKKFVNKIIKQIEEGENNLHVVKDKLGTPTYTHDFARNVFELLKTEFYGLYNMVCGGDCSRYDVAEEIVKILNRNDSVKVSKVGSDYFSKEYFAPRPDSEKLLNMKLAQRNIDIMGDWKGKLREYLECYFKHLIVEEV